MSEHEKEILMEHEVDGIRELDNRLPRWWVWLFYLTTIFGVIYVFYFHILEIGPSVNEAYQQEMGMGEEAVGAVAAAPAAAIPTTPSTDGAVLAKGKEIFLGQCIACHGAEGQGTIGPNMTDEYFKHGPTFADSVHIIEVGVPAKGMISWKPVLDADQIYAVASYIYTFRGTSPADPKDPEGDLYPGSAEM